ncbi:conserved hypothetical protein [Candidatus Methylobacter favarea]|uniref:Uncharacterized protein n=1 Tax=Candidatus Methylobacter favarea TaxID=2707345 RepID=A0A8S0XKJ4_9GAMM|nr:hypothetical protein [Candidatus Methylobacter favarea]CAA9892102.1 conserved hypothetical protein [Candidatus Methylobacter favarea]
MASNEIDWDKHFSKLTWNEVYENSPFFHGQHLPTLFSPDGTRIYISSLDFEYATDNVPLLKLALDHIKSSFDMAKRSNRYYKMAMAKSDFSAVQGLLSQLGADETSHRLVEDSV